MVKAVAKMHNLPNQSHRDLFRAIRRIGTHIMQDRHLMREFVRINDLHENFYEGEMTDVEIAQRHATTSRFVTKMQQVLDAS